MLKRKNAKDKTPKKQNKKRITFKLDAPEAQFVSLVGDFNSWNPDSHLLKKNSNGSWKISVSLPPGRYEYRFMVDGQWHNDPNCDSCVPNPFGSENCIITL
jgi:1,4-alpha-glucan branching enzyme